MKISIILRGEHGKRASKIISERFQTEIFELPENLPEIIDEPEKIEIPERIFDADIIISYAFHPDVNYEIVKRAKKYVILPGGAESGSITQLKRVAGDRVKIIWEEVCCATPNIEDDEVKEFFEMFGMPEFEVEVENGVIKDVKVKRETICGSAKFVAERLKGMKIDEAPTKAGFLAQISPCLASRGLKGNIHKAGNIHKRQIEKAIKKVIERSQEE